MNVLYALVIVVIALWLAGFVNWLMTRIANSNEKLEDALFEFLGRLAQYRILAFAGVIMVLERLGITTTSLVALIAAATGEGRIRQAQDRNPVPAPGGNHEEGDCA